MQNNTPFISRQNLAHRAKFIRIMGKSIDTLSPDPAMENAARTDPKDAIKIEFSF